MENELTNFKPEEVAKKIINFIKKEVQEAGFKRVIIPLSGGIDSSTTAFLAVKALGPDNVLVVELPYKDLNHDRDAELVIAQLKIPLANVYEIEISEIVESFVKKLPKPDRLRTANIMARIRMILLYDLAKKHQALVCGTENKSEYLLGYFTRFGDEASDLEPIRNLYKTEVLKLAKYLGVPEKIIEKAPTAGLWKGQTDEGELGFSYEQADPILYLHFDKKYSCEEIVKKGYKKELVEKVKTQVEANRFKHEVPKTLPV
ncbi:NAD+ synthase, partial [Candidatus Gottesmanbacteria bacterium]|nr:NAD+ synthase [Candidatus Gottesmanbacteria bacterium]